MAAGRERGRAASPPRAPSVPPRPDRNPRGGGSARGGAPRAALAAEGAGWTAGLSISAHRPPARAAPAARNLQAAGGAWRLLRPVGAAGTG